MAKVSGSKGPVRGATPSALQPTGPAAATPSAPTQAASDGFSQAATDMVGYKSSPLLTGAMKIFGDSVILPSNLTDPNNPRNNPKYLRLLAAVLGLDDLERHFQTLEGEKQEEYLAMKADQRERHLEKVEREKEEKRRQKEQKQSQGEDG